jgi:uncharacterized protein (UPF0333 family)
MKTKRRGQVSVEYLIVLGFATFAITGIIGIAFYYINTTQDQMTANHVHNLANTILDNAESVYYAGSPSKMTITPYVPKGIEDIEFVQDPGNTEYYIRVTYFASTGQNIIAFKSDVPLDTTSSISSTEGIKTVVIEFEADKIKISEAS